MSRLNNGSMKSLFHNTSLFTTFFHIGLFTIGGGYAMIPLIEQKVVDEKHWVGHDELLDLIAEAARNARNPQETPAPIATPAP